MKTKTAITFSHHKSKLLSAPAAAESNWEMNEYANLSIFILISQHSVPSTADASQGLYSIISLGGPLVSWKFMHLTQITSTRTNYKMMLNMV